MKKALSLILALVMIFALATVAFADTAHVVGNQSENQGVEPGAFTATPPNVNVNINVSAVGTVHKYAVDVTWSDTAIDLGGGTMTWDVKTMKYVTAGTPTGVGSKTWDITVTNYSDLPVYAYATITDLMPADHMLITANADNENRLEIGKAVAGVAGANGTATPGTIVISLTPDTANSKTWADVVEWYTINHAGATSVTAGTATISIAKDQYVAPTP